MFLPASRDEARTAADSKPGTAPVRPDVSEESNLLKGGRGGRHVQEITAGWEGRAAANLDPKDCRDELRMRGEGGEALGLEEGE